MTSSTIILPVTLADRSFHRVRRYGMTLTMASKGTFQDPDRHLMFCYLWRPDAIRILCYAYNAWLQFTNIPLEGSKKSRVAFQMALIEDELNQKFPFFQQAPTGCLYHYIKEESQFVSFEVVYYEPPSIGPVIGPTTPQTPFAAFPGYVSHLLNEVQRQLLYGPLLSQILLLQRQAYENKSSSKKQLSTSFQTTEDKKSSSTATQMVSTSSSHTSHSFHPSSKANKKHTRYRKEKAAKRYNHPPQESKKNQKSSNFQYIYPKSFKRLSPIREEDNGDERNG